MKACSGRRRNGQAEGARLLTNSPSLSYATAR
jgi:hypothetical protein